MEFGGLFLSLVKFKPSRYVKIKPHNSMMKNLMQYQLVAIIFLQIVSTVVRHFVLHVELF